MKKITSLILALSVVGQNFLFFQNIVFADDSTGINLGKSGNNISDTIIAKEEQITKQIRLHNGLSNAKIDFDKNANIKMIGNLDIKSSGDHKADLQNILGAIDNQISFKTNPLDFNMLSELTDKSTFGKHTRLSETYKGIPIFGKQVVIHEDENNIIKSLSTEISQDINVDIIPKLNSNEVLKIGENSLTSSNNFQITKQPSLIIYPISDYDSVLAYNFEINSNNINNGNKERWEFFVEAGKGEILMKFNKIMELTPTYNGTMTTISGSLMPGEGGATVSFSGWKDDTSTGYFLLDNNQNYVLYNYSSNSGTYNDAKSYSYKSTSAWGSSDPIAISAANNISTTLSYYKNNFNYSTANIASLTGTHLYVFIHEIMDNAYRDGQQIVIGDGDGVTDGSLATMDIVGHEFSHAWTENTSNLTYYGEPGALNESFSDIMGANIEFYGQQDGTFAYPNKVAGKADWLMGEDSAYTGAFRDMENPHNYNQPSRYLGTEWYSGVGDNGGVHYNSSIQNLFYYYLVAGGTGNNEGINYSVNGVGINQAQNLAYNVNTYYMMPNYDYPLASLAWINAADALDPTGALTSSVKQAWAAVGVNGDVLDQYPSLVDYNFASGSTIPSSFSLSGSALWSIDTSTGVSSVGSLVSGNIGDNQNTSITWSGNTNSGYLGYRYKTSSEAGYDKLNFYVDNTLISSKSGINPWSFYDKLVSGGAHSFKWEYSKDISDSGGLDRVWIDNITLPVGASGSFAVNVTPTVILNNSNYYTSGSTVSLSLNSSKKDSTLTFSGADFSSGSHSFVSSLTGSSNLNIISSGTGMKNISATLVDKLGNIKLLTGSVIFDDEGPTAPLFSGGIVYHSGNINLTWGDSVDGLVGSANRYYYELLNNYNSYTSSGTTTSTGIIKNGLGDGEYGFLVKGYDLLGNVSLASTGSLIIDSGIPTASGIFLSGAYSNTGTNMLRLISSEQINYDITSTGITSSLSGITSSGITYLPITLSGSDGVKNLNIDFSDSAGNTGTTTSSIILDSTAPNYILNIYNSLLVQGTSFTISGSVNDEYSGVGTVSINGTNLTGSLVNWTNGVNLVAGINLFSFVFTDNLGNSTSTGVNIVRTSITNNVGSIVNSTGSVSINFDTDISATGGLIYGTASNNLNNNIIGNSYGTNNSINLSGLNSNTTYYYKVFGKNLGFTGQLSNLYSFNTPQSLVDSTGSQVATGSVIISGASSTGVLFNSSTGSATIFSNDGDDSIILNLAGLSIFASGANWDGILQGPAIYATGLSLNSTGYTRVGNYYEIGNANSSLILSGNTATISINIGSSYNGRTLNIYRSEDRQNFSSFATCLVSAGICQFTTDHFSLFAFGSPSDATPDTFNFIPVTLAELNQEYTSNTLTITGINTSAPITISGGTYKINNGSHTSASGTINSGDQVIIKLTSSSSYSTTMTSTVTIGGVSSNYTVSTKSISSGGGGGGGGGYSYPKVTIAGSGIINSGSIDSTTNLTNSTRKKNIKIVKVVLTDIGDSFAKDDITNLVNKGIIKGFSDGTFRPNSNATRAEFLAIAMKAFNIDLTSKSENSFTDIDSSVSWISPYVIKAKELGIISGQMKQRKMIFRPNDSITRAEALVILFKIAKIDTKSIKKLEFKDDFVSWMIPYVIKAKELGIVSGQIIDGKLIFRPNDSITRAESARIITKMLGLSK